MSKTPVRAKSRKDQDELPKAEADRRRDELARRILRTPPQPREESKVGKREDDKKPSTKAKKRAPQASKHRQSKK
jgi:hypothetical protein